ncbi:hypothetical protein AAHE18_09G000800 [Arachis hypogaea]
MIGIGLRSCRRRLKLKPKRNMVVIETEKYTVNMGTEEETDIEGIEEIEGTGMINMIEMKVIEIGIEIEIEIMMIMMMKKGILGEGEGIERTIEVWIRIRIDMRGRGEMAVKKKMVVMVKKMVVVTGKIGGI